MRVLAVIARRWLYIDGGEVTLEGNLTAPGESPRSPASQLTIDHGIDYASKQHIGD